MITADVDMTGFNQGIAALLRSVGATSRIIVEKETGELIKTLVRLSPPKNLAGSKKNATRNVRSVFSPIRDYYFKDAKAGKGRMRWLAATPQVLVGVNIEHYLPNIGTEDAFKKYKTTRGKFGYASQRVIKNQQVARRGVQAIVRIARLVTQAKTIASVVNRQVKNFGRQKSAWLVSVYSGAIKISGANMPPKWVTKHFSGARGRFQSGLGETLNPHFTISNHAAGVTSEQAQKAQQTALNIRARAMKANARLFTQGKKNLADYAR